MESSKHKKAALYDPPPPNSPSVSTPFLDKNPATTTTAATADMATNFNEDYDNTNNNTNDRVDIAIEGQSNTSNLKSRKKFMPHDHIASKEFASGYGTRDSPRSSLLKTPKVPPLTRQQSQRLLRVGCVTSLAVIAHNFPEGLATFTSTVSDPNLGALVAIAVAIHNMPLGITVGMPIYLAEGARLKAVLYASFAGLSSLVGGLVGWLIYARKGGATQNELNGGLFGCVIGIMMWTAFKELLPQAREHDPHDKYTSWLIFAGFLVMDISLVIFDSQGTVG